MDSRKSNEFISATRKLDSTSSVAQPILHYRREQKSQSMQITNQFRRIFFSRKLKARDDPCHIAVPQINESPSIGITQPAPTQIPEFYIGQIGIPELQIPRAKVKTVNNIRILSQSQRKKKKKIEVKIRAPDQIATKALTPIAQSMQVQAQFNEPFQQQQKTVVQPKDSNSQLFQMQFVSRSTQYSENSKLITGQKSIQNPFLLPVYNYQCLPNFKHREEQLNLNNQSNPFMQEDKERRWVWQNSKRRKQKKLRVND